VTQQARLGEEVSMSDRRNVTRRRLLEGGAVAAGLVWSAPAVRSVRLLDANGTPPPSSTTSTGTTPPMTTFDLVGSFADAIVAFDDPRLTFDDFVVLFAAPIGTSTMSLQVVVQRELDIGFLFIGGTFLIVAANGEISGEVTGGSATAADLRYQADLSITAGQGAFAGASGSATIFGSIIFSEASGDVLGTFTVPSVS
jgi:hypothetical protein